MVLCLLGFYIYIHTRVQTDVRNQQQVKGPLSPSPHILALELDIPLCLTLQLSFVNITVSVRPQRSHLASGGLMCWLPRFWIQLYYLCPLPFHVLLSAELHHLLFILSCSVHNTFLYTHLDGWSFDCCSRFIYMFQQGYRNTLLTIFSFTQRSPHEKKSTKTTFLHFVFCIYLSLALTVFIIRNIKSWL